MFKNSAASKKSGDHLWWHLRSVSVLFAYEFMMICSCIFQNLLNGFLITSIMLLCFAASKEPCDHLWWYSRAVSWSCWTFSNRREGIFLCPLHLCYCFGVLPFKLSSYILCWSVILLFYINLGSITNGIESHCCWVFFPAPYYFFVLL